VSLLPALVIAAAAVIGPAPGLTAAPSLGSSALPPLSACPAQTDLAAPAPEQQRAMRCDVNTTRRSIGLRALRSAWRLNRSALLRARAILRCRQFSHTPCGQSFARVFVRVGYLGRSGTVGENLAWGEAPAGTARGTLEQWLASPEHRSNLLWPRWSDIGIAVVKAPSLFGGTSVELWVVQFGCH
jgi:uncharacterized protein YkwD